MTKARVFLFLLLFFPNCDKQPAADKPGGAAPAEAGPSVRLLDAGTGPRTALRVTVNKGDKQSAVLTMTMAMATSVGGQAMPSVKLPAIQLTMDLEVTEVTPGRDLRYSFELSKMDTVADPEVLPQVRAMLNTQLQALVGVSGSALVTDRGITKEMDIAYPPGLDAQTRQLMDGMKQNMNQLAAPFPEEEVGQGASWEVTMRLSINGLTLTQVATYTLVELGKGGGTVKVAIRQKADPQEMKAPGLPPGTKVHLEEMSSTGGGDAHFELNRLLPPASTGQIKTSMRAMIEAEGQKQPMTMDMELGMKFEGK